MISLFDVMKYDSAVLSSSVVTIGLLFFMCLLWAFTHNNKTKYGKLPPSPPWIPILGSVPFLGTEAEKKFQQWSEKYNSSILYTKMGDHWSVVLNSAEAIEEVSSKFQVSKWNTEYRLSMSSKKMSNQDFF